MNNGDIKRLIIRRKISNKNLGGEKYQRKKNSRMKMKNFSFKRNFTKRQAASSHGNFRNSPRITQTNTYADTNNTPNGGGELQKLCSLLLS